MSQRKLLLPPFHGARMQGYEEKMTEIAAREIETWPLRPPAQAATANAGDDARDHPSRRSSASTAASGWRSCASPCASSST